MRVNQWTIFVVVMLLICFQLPRTSLAASKTYTITPTSKPYKGGMTNFSTYNKYTKQYYLLRSYLEHLEKIGGGTLILNKGTYTITNTLYVPSNVTIYFKSGSKILKGRDTGTRKFSPSKSIFQLVKPSDAYKNGIRSKYNGEKNIRFIGEGKAIIDLQFDEHTIAIVCGHNQNIQIQNIQFQHLNSGHFLEVDATENMLITNNYFIDSKASPKENKEAINLDTPDLLTKGFNNPWSNHDKTPNRNITINNNTFKNLDRAIGTHKYSEGKYHDQIIIQKNDIETTRMDAIRVLNWSNSIIEDNTIKNVAGQKGTFRGILASGAMNPTFRNNKIENTARPIQFMPWKNSGPGSVYHPTYNHLTSENINSLKTNRAINTIESFIRINEVYNVFDRDTEKIVLNP
ncbi:right-handed parallel beta-helix repeat-containing protein [Neobacillus niacini]|uniref:right-handed parallel beta-helix repeat-containing protein n=1 Tax=Neobacillus niacini TaxID=86668 RepID=UPI0028607451|nr:right-handed parallel beta-helix repeat-containing protein [Neobacillus niacini]MDR6998830.1 hypothetical protein [Neobacillus niacini]